MSTPMSALERLEKILDEKDEELAVIKAELAKLKQRNEYGESWAWMRQTHSDTDFTPGLPCPRLEIQWYDIDGYTWIAEYSLVYRFHLGEYVRVPLSKTKVTGGGKVRVWDGKVELPYRDGTHIRHDMRAMNLPGYAISGESINELSPMTEPNFYDSDR